MERILTLQNFNVTYQNGNENKSVYAVKNINLSIESGDSLGIVGESGSGKSTLAMAMLGLLAENTAKIDGKALFLGKNLTEMDAQHMKALRWKDLSVVFQKSMNSLSPVHKISTQVEDIYRVHAPKATKKEIRDRFVYLLSLVNLPERIYRLYPHQLSGGMLQRVSIALSLIHGPKLLILDEATTALDVVTQGQILDEIVKMEQTLHMTRIMITHDMSVVAASCNKVAVLYAGELMEIGYVKDVLKNPKHPYTQGLVKAFPELTGEKKPLAAISGSLPDLSQQFEGCVFEPRCLHAMAICKSQKPKPVQIGETQEVHCHLYTQGGKSNGLK